MAVYVGYALFCASCLGLGLIGAQVLVLRRHLCAPPARAARKPAISILKPLCGLDDGLKRNLTTFAHLDYPEYEVVLGVRDVRDPAWKVARAAARRWPGRFRAVVQRGEPGLNPKVNQLVTLARAAPRRDGGRRLADLFGALCAGCHLCGEGGARRRQRQGPPAGRVPGASARPRADEGHGARNRVGLLLRPARRGVARSADHRRARHAHRAARPRRLPGRPESQRGERLITSVMSGLYRCLRGIVTHLLRTRPCLDTLSTSEEVDSRQRWLRRSGPR